MGAFPGGLNNKESACNAGDRLQSLGWEDPLGKGMAAHSRILAWRISWTEEPGGIQSKGLQSRTQLSDFHSLTHRCSELAYFICKRQRLTVILLIISSGPKST